MGHLKCQGWRITIVREGLGRQGWILLSGRSWDVSRIDTIVREGLGRQGLILLSGRGWDSRDGD